MEYIIWFRPYSGDGPPRPDYEIRVKAAPGVHVPKYLAEDERGGVQCLATGRSWDSLGEMTHDLRMEIVGWGSDVGN